MRLHVNDHVRVNACGEIVDGLLCVFHANWSAVGDMLSVRQNDVSHSIRGLDVLSIFWTEVIVEKIKRLLNNFLREWGVVCLILKCV